MISIKRTDSDNKDFQNLVSELDKDLAIKNGEMDDFFVQYNKIDQIKNVVLAFHDDKAIGCGAIKQYDAKTMEIKRMFVLVEMRGKGVATLILQDLEKWVKELGSDKCILETGDKMPDAVALYRKSNYKIIPNYGQYKDIESSICFEKYL